MVGDLRCPFCHDTLEADPLVRVECFICAAPHHAQCFVEGRGCAATGCERTTARVGSAQVPLDTLQSIASSREALARLALPTPEPEPRGAASSLAAAAVGLLVVAAASYSQGAVFATAVAFVLLLLAALRASRDHLAPAGESLRLPTGRDPSDVRPEESFDPIFGTFRLGSWVPGVAPDHGEFLRERIAEQRLPPQDPAAKPPTVCPHCKGDLAPGDDGDDADAELWFCYHCGRSLSASASRDEDEGQGEVKAGGGRVKA